MATKQYYLQPDVFIQRSERRYVLLDVRTDRYFCIEKSAVDSLGPQLLGWTDDNPALHGHTLGDSADATELAAELVSSGILSENTGKPFRPDAIAPATHELRQYDDTSVTRLAHAPRFISTCAWAHYLLKYRPFSKVVRLIANRPRYIHNKIPQDISETISIYTSLRSFYPRPSHSMCLFNSLSLLLFFRKCRLDADWVFGVMEEPFQAHCWVQIGSTVINDTLQRVSQYAPIMKV